MGIYLSAHPLDEYRVILENVCTVSMSQMEDRTALVNKDLILGGVVTGVRESRMKNGKPCGFTTVEDFTGSYEIAQFGEPWLKWSNMMKVGNFLFIKAKFVPYKYNPEKTDFVINSIELLQDVKDSVISSLTVSMPLSELDREFVSDIDTLTQKEGKTTLRFIFNDLSDPENSRLSLTSGSRKISVTTELIDYLKSKDSISLSFK